MDPALLARDLENALAALPGGVLVSLGTATAKGNLQKQSKVYQDGEGRLRSAGLQVELRIVQDALPGLDIDDLIATSPLPPATGSLTAWKVRDIWSEPDGSARLELTKP